MNETGVNSANELGNDKTVASHSSIVGVIVVGAVVLWFKVVASIEELADVSAAGSFDDEFTAWVVWSIISSVKNKVIKKKKVTLSFSGDCVEFFFSHGGNRSPELLELTNVDLMTNFHESPSTEEENDNSNIKERRATIESDILGFDT